VSDQPIEKGVSINAEPPFTYGIGLQGELIISWKVGNLPEHLPLRMYLSIPAEHLPGLRRGLEETRAVQETLAAKPPTGSAH
jgi:hypothetical protein